MSTPGVSVIRRPGGSTWGDGRGAGLAVGVTLEQLSDAGQGAEVTGGVEREEHLGGPAVGHLTQRLQVLDGDQVGRGVALVDGVEDGCGGLGLALGQGDPPELLGLGDRLHGLGLTLGGEDVALPDALGGEDRGRLLALGPGDGRFPLAPAVVTTAPARPARPSSARAWRARRPGGGSMRWISTRTTRTPHLSVASSRIWRSAALMVSREVSAWSSCMSPMTLRRLVWASLVMARIEVGDVVDQPLRVGGLVVDDGVDGDDHVVGRDDLLRRHVDHLLAHVDAARIVSTNGMIVRRPGSTVTLYLPSRSTRPRS